MEPYWRGLSLGLLGEAAIVGKCLPRLAEEEEDLSSGESEGGGNRGAMGVKLLVGWPRRPKEMISTPAMACANSMEEALSKSVCNQG